MLFAKQVLQDLVYENESADHRFKVVENKIVGTGRWSIHHRMVFSLNSLFFASNYDTGATEQQNEQAYDSHGEWIECPQVFARRVTIEYVEQP